MLNVMVTGLLCISMLLVASSCNLCLFTVKFYWNIKKKKKKNKSKASCQSSSETQVAKSHVVHSRNDFQEQNEHISEKKDKSKLLLWAFICLVDDSIHCDFWV